MRGLLLGAAVAAMLTASPAFAARPEPPISDPQQLVDSVTQDSLSSLMREIGAADVQSVQSDTNKIVVFKVGDVPFNLGLAMCDETPGKCIAYTTIVIVDPGSAGPIAQDVFNAFNRDNLFVTLVKLDGNRYAAGRITLIDGGVTKKNLAVNIASFVLTFDVAMKYLATQYVASAKPTDPFQKVSAQPPRAVPATPQDMAKVMKALEMKYTTTLDAQQ